MNLVHERAYAKDGEGWIIFDLFGALIDSLSESVMIFLVLKLANGWYSSYYKYDASVGIDQYGLPYCLVVLV